MTYMRIKIKVIYKPIFRMITEVVMNRIQEEEDFSTDTKEFIKKPHSWFISVILACPESFL